ncbi:DsbA family protein [Indioceanicola profundi]|uniref:DsbA family protein n=1 Tax=Indioceanicola profundi TaxID=2220096 RepID=UPI0013C4723C|nr:DsbA family protein [Indioceanicola profundi]
MRRNLRTDLTRRGLFGLTLTATAAAALPAWAQGASGGAGLDPWMGEKVYGNPDAPVTLIEYASLACSHCATFHKEIWPKLKAEFVDPGQVKLIFRDFPLNAPGLRAHQLARCAGEKRFEGLKDVLFKSQATWLNQDYEKRLAMVARMAGLTQAQFDACMADKQLENFLIQSQATGGSKYNVNSTPTFIVENTGTTVAGANEKELFEALEDAGAKRKAP